MIRIFDAQVGSTQEGGSVTVQAWTTAFRWAIEQRARVINVSIVCPWREPAIAGLVNGNTNVLFLATSGNANTEFGADYLQSNGLTGGNVLVVGGCARDGSRENNRGFGAGIDVHVPSVRVPGRIAMQFAQQQEHARRLLFRQQEDAKLDTTRTVIRKLEEKQRLADPNDQALQRRLGSQLSRERKFLASGEAQLPEVHNTPEALGLGPQHQQIADDGVSFGIPMVANVAAKMILLMPNIPPREIIRTMRETARTDCAVGRVLDPSACYRAALELRRGWVTRI